MLQLAALGNWRSLRDTASELCAEDKGHGWLVWISVSLRPAYFGTCPATAGCCALVLTSDTVPAHSLEEVQASCVDIDKNLILLGLGSRDLGPGISSTPTKLHSHANVAGVLVL